jgi:hypothetical protein
MLSVILASTSQRTILEFNHIVPLGTHSSTNPLPYQEKMEATETTKPKKTRNRKTTYDATYCISLTSGQLQQLHDQSAMHRMPISKMIREAITEYVNKGRI